MPRCADLRGFLLFLLIFGAYDAFMFLVLNGLNVLSLIGFVFSMAVMALTGYAIFCDKYC